MPCFLELLVYLAISPALAGGGLGLRLDSGVVRDRVASIRTYGGAVVGPQGSISGGSAVRWHASAFAGLGGLGPLGLGRRSFTNTRTDLLTGEVQQQRLDAPRMDARWDVALGLERPHGDTAVGLEARWRAELATGLALSTWAWSSAQLRPRVRHGWALGRLRGELSGSVALLGLVSRLPWSANPIQPDRTLAGGFLSSGTRISGPWSHLGGIGALSLVGGGPTLGLQLAVSHDWVPAPLTEASLSLGAGWRW